jgi:flagellar hook-length control protein FliK
MSMQTLNMPKAAAGTAAANPRAQAAHGAHAARANQAAATDFAFLDGADAGGFAAALADAGTARDTQSLPTAGDAGGKRPAAGDPAQVDIGALLPGWPPTTPPLLPPTAAAQASDAAKARGTPADAALAAAGAARESRTELHAAALSAREACDAPPGLAMQGNETRARGEGERASSALTLAGGAPTNPAAEPAPPVPAAHGAKAVAEPSVAAIAPPAQAMALAMPTAAGAHLPTPPHFEARIAVPLDSPAFAPALATQVTWLAQEGVQQARLSLNPAEMGPLTVKIVLEGTQARIDFSADMADTRSAIEASLPTLAAALNDQGLTLAGGGVFDGQARHGAQREREGQAPQPGAAGNPGAPTTAPRATGTATQDNRRGLVDLVA